MKTKIKNLIAFVMLSGALLTLVFALPNPQPKGNPQAAPQVTVPSIVSTSSGNGGMHTRANTVLPSVRYGAHIDVNQASVTLEKLDLRSVTLKAPNQIGVNRSVAVSPTTRPQRFVNSDGSKIIVLIIKSSGASGIGIHFQNFALAHSEEVYVYGPAANSIVFGPFTNKGPWRNGEFWSGTLDGNTAIIEFYTRTRENRKAFEVFEVSHIFPELGGGLPPAQPQDTPLPCEVDASCYPDNLNDAVGRILFNNNGMTLVCTGTLLNDCGAHGIPFFLTANHCVPSQAVAQTVEVYWFYQTTSCNSGVLRSDIVHQTGGANFLAGQNTNDFSLLQLVNNAPGGAVYSGWTTGQQSTGTGVFGIHHPQGYLPPDVYSYLRRSSGTITSGYINCSTGLTDGYYVPWTSGATEHGSSGSGLFLNPAGQQYLVGVDSCGPITDTCTSPFGWYSKFDNFYSQIQPYICSATFPPFFNGQVSLGNGIYYLQFPNGTPFGYYSYLNDPHFIYHFDMGYEYWFDANDGQGGIFFYDFASNHFFYTSPSFPFPYLYDFSLNTILYYFPDPTNPGHYTTNPRFFFDFATGHVITM